MVKITQCNIDKDNKLHIVRPKDTISSRYIGTYRRRLAVKWGVDPWNINLTFEEENHG